MPVVPVSGGQSVGPGQTPNVRAPLEDFGGGQADRPFDLSGLADTAQKIYQAQKFKADQIAVVDAASKLSATESDTLYNPDYGALNTRGKNAAGAIDDASTRWQKATDDIRGTLTNDDQKIQFERMAQAHWSSINEQVQRHAAGEAKTYDQESTSAYVSNEHDAAIAAGLVDPKRVQQSIDNQSAAIRDFGARNGWPAEEIAQHVAETVSKTRFGVLERMVNAEQDQAATSYLTLNRADFVGKDLTDAERLTDAGTVRGESQRQSDRITIGGKAAGLITPGNIDLTNRPRVANPDGTVSTVRSMSIEENGKEILIPAVSDAGKLLTDDEAVKQYHDTGKHLGVFQDAASANAYAERLHTAQAQMLAGQGSGIPDGPAPDLGSALHQVQDIQDPRVRDATEQRVRRVYADKAADERQQKATAFQQASTVVEQTGDFNKVPMAARLLLSPEENGALQHRADQIAHPIRQTDPDIKNSLLNGAGLNRAHFEQLDLSQYREQLSDKDYNTILSKQLSMRLETQRTGAAADRHEQYIREAEARRKQHQAEAVATKAAAAKAKHDAAMKTLQDMGVKIGPTAPGGPLRTPPPNIPTPPGAAGAPGGVNLGKPPAPTDSIASLPIPDTWKAAAVDDSDYADYLNHHGAIA